MRARLAAAIAGGVATAMRLFLASLVDLMGLGGFTATVAGVHEIWGRGWALLAAGALLLSAYVLVEFLVPLRLRGRRAER